MPRFKTKVYPVFEGCHYSIGLRIRWQAALSSVVIENVSADGPAGSAQPPITRGDTLVLVNTVRITGLQKALDTIQRICSRAVARGQPVILTLDRADAGGDGDGFQRGGAGAGAGAGSGAEASAGASTYTDAAEIPGSAHPFDAAMSIMMDMDALQAPPPPQVAAVPGNDSGGSDMLAQLPADTKQEELEQMMEMVANGLDPRASLNALRACNGDICEAIARVCAAEDKAAAEQQRREEEQFEQQIVQAQLQSEEGKTAEAEKRRSTEAERLAVCPLLKEFEDSILLAPSKSTFPCNPLRVLAQLAPPITVVAAKAAAVTAGATVSTPLGVAACEASLSSCSSSSASVNSITADTTSAHLVRPSMIQLLKLENQAKKWYDKSAAAYMRQLRQRLCYDLSFPHASEAECARCWQLADTDGVAGASAVVGASADAKAEIRTGVRLPLMHVLVRLDAATNELREALFSLTEGGGAPTLFVSALETEGGTAKLSLEEDGLEIVEQPIQSHSQDQGKQGKRNTSEGASCPAACKNTASSCPRAANTGAQDERCVRAKATSNSSPGSLRDVACVALPSTALPMNATTG